MTIIVFVVYIEKQKQSKKKIWRWIQLLCACVCVCHLLAAALFFLRQWMLFCSWCCRCCFCNSIIIIIIFHLYDSSLWLAMPLCSIVRPSVRLSLLIYTIFVCMFIVFCIVYSLHHYGNFAIFFISLRNVGSFCCEFVLVGWRCLMKIVRFVGYVSFVHSTKRLVCFYIFAFKFWGYTF